MILINSVYFEILFISRIFRIIGALFLLWDDFGAFQVNRLIDILIEARVFKTSFFDFATKITFFEFESIIIVSVSIFTIIIVLVNLAIFSGGI